MPVQNEVKPMVFVCEPLPDNHPERRYGVGSSWGEYEIAVKYMDPNLLNPQMHEWLLISRQVLANLHKATGAFLAKEAHGA